MEPGLARAARRRAAALQLPLATYLRILVRNDALMPREILQGEPSRAAGPYSAQKLSFDLPKGERARLAKRIAPLTVSAYVQGLVRNDLMSPENDLLVLARESKPAIE